MLETPLSIPPIPGSKFPSATVNSYSAAYGGHLHPTFDPNPHEDPSYSGQRSHLMSLDSALRTWLLTANAKIGNCEAFCLPDSVGTLQPASNRSAGALGELSNPLPSPGTVVPNLVETTQGS